MTEKIFVGNFRTSDNNSVSSSKYVSVSHYHHHHRHSFGYISVSSPPSQVELISQLFPSIQMWSHCGLWNHEEKIYCLTFSAHPFKEAAVSVNQKNYRNPQTKRRRKGFWQQNCQVKYKNLQVCGWLAQGCSFKSLFRGSSQACQADIFCQNLALEFSCQCQS